MRTGIIAAIKVLQDARDYADEIEAARITILIERLLDLLEEEAMPTILQGHSYPFAVLADVIAAEARQGRTVRIAIQHAGGWAVTGENPGCTCRERMGDDGRFCSQCDEDMFRVFFKLDEEHRRNPYWECQERGAREPLA